MIRKFFALASLAGMLAASAAGAGEYGPEGAPRAQRFNYTCPEGHYLVGLSGNAGDHLDKLVPVCAPWSEGRLGGQILGPPFGQSFEGTPSSAICKADHAISALFARLPYIEATCSGVAAPHTPDSVKPELASGSAPPGSRYAAPCPKGELGIGVAGRAGQYVDYISLVCGPAPK